jgi:hypothetical protein
LFEYCSLEVARAFYGKFGHVLAEIFVIFNLFTIAEDMAIAEARTPIVHLVPITPESLS